MMNMICILIFALVALAVQPLPAVAAGVTALFDLSSRSGGPFPTDRFTVPDPSQNTGLRVSLRKPDCAVRVSDCEDIDLLNQLDGFNVFPRVSIPFSGPIDVTTVSSATVFVVSLGSTRPGGLPAGKVVGIEQIVWDVATNTLHVRPADILDQHTRYALIVTREVQDTAGDPLEANGAFQSFRRGVKRGQLGDAALTAYREALLAALEEATSAGVSANDIAVASVFTTRSVSATLEKIRDQISASGAAPADFLLGPGGRRTVFPFADVARLFFRQQVTTAPTFAEISLANRLQFLRIVPGAVGTLAFGKYSAPNYLDLEFGPYIRPFGTLSGTPQVLGTSDIYFNLFLPAETETRRRPATGWPLAIYGPGSDETKQNAVFNVAAILASHGIATIAINPFARGGGSLSTLRIELTSGETVSFPAGGRNIDANGDGTIGSTENFQALPPRATLGNIPGITQTIADHITLVRVVEAGMDVDGDGVLDIDASRIYYIGISQGAQIGVTFVAVEPNVRALVANSPGGLVAGEQGRLSPLNRPGLANNLAERIPSLINCDGVTDLGGILVGPPCFNENLPLRGDPPVINEVAGAVEIQEVLENRQWLQAVKEPFTFAPYLRKTPLARGRSKPVLMQFGRGDQNLTNPVASAMIRSGALEDRTTYYRNDLAFAWDPAIRKNPHSFLVRTDQPPTDPNFAIAVAAQEQAAIFIATDGAETIDPDGPCLASGEGCLFEVPIALPLPEDLGFIP